jgi:hypothetical protein
VTGESIAIVAPLFGCSLPLGKISADVVDPHFL